MPKLLQEDTECVGWGRYAPVTRRQCPNCGALLKVIWRGHAMYYLSVFTAIAALFVVREAMLNLSLTVLVAFVATIATYVRSLVLVGIEVVENGELQSTEQLFEAFG